MHRRDWLKMSSFGVAGASASGWFGLLADRARAAAQEGVKHKSCILLWMQGGPAQSHTFDLKSGGDFKPISTAANGVQISEHLPKLAQRARDFAILRSLSTSDNNHPTATYLMHTGYRKGTGGVVHPSLGAMAAADLGRPDLDLPSFVSVGPTLGSGYLGPKFAPLIVNELGKAMPDLKPLADDIDERASLVEELDRAFQTDYGATSTKAHATGFARAMSLMKSSRTQAFELNREPEKSRTLYGASRFGQGCLLARRLVESGVPFVEVNLNGWDTHNDTPRRIKTLSEQFDGPMAALLGDLKERGLLDTTLVVWMGEFGRSPGHGRNHYARAWSAVLAGGGVKGGKVVGKTDTKGDEVTERPVSAPDFMATVCHALGIDHTKNYQGRGNRPMPKVAKGAKVVTELFA